MEGKVKLANSQGFGFIETDMGIDFFFHHTKFQGNWKELLGCMVKGKVVNVTFDVDDTAVEPRAINVCEVKCG